MKIEEILTEEELNCEASGNCYEVAMDLLTEAHLKGIPAKLVHGRPILAGGPYEGCEYGHAWVEVMDGKPFPFEMCKAEFCEEGIPKAFFYMGGQIDASKNKYYTYEEAASLALSTGHYGPWEEEDNG